MKIKVLFLAFALALTAWGQTETKNSTPAPEKKSCCGSAEMSCCGGMKDSKDGKMKCDMSDKDAKGCCSGMKDMADMKGMDHMQHMKDMKDMKGEHAGMSCCGGMKNSKDGKMKCDMAGHDMTAQKDAKEAKPSTDTKEAKGCCGDKCPMHGDHNHAAHSGN